MTSAIPSFAVIGAVNHGKSSVVSTLAEDDEIRVSAMPGETVDVKRFRLSDLLVFYDTPGFQNARKALKEIQESPASDDPLARFRDFVKRHRDDPQFDAECRLLEPILAGSGIIYVVDGSLPVTDLHRCELELVRLTAAPRLAIVNRTGQRDHVDAWQAALAQTFNAVREFNAHRASFEDRKDLLETLANIERSWKRPLQEAIEALRQDRLVRISDVGAMVAALLRECLTFSKRTSIDGQDAKAREGVALTLKEQFKAEMAAIEAKAHETIIELFAHRLVKSPGESASLFKDELFSEETWRMLGLNSRQLVGAGAVAGGVIGASTDALTLGHTLLLGTAVGTSIGAVGAYLIGKQRPEIAVELSVASLPAAVRLLLPEKLRLSEHEIVVGPVRAINFPWILIDRALCTFAYVASRAHARRDQMKIKVDTLLPPLEAAKLTVSHWSPEDRKESERFFATLRKNKALSEKELAAWTGMFVRRLSDVDSVVSDSMRWAEV